MIIKTGLDIKSISINLITILLFLLPFISYAHPENARNYVSYWFIGLAIMYLVPPRGWRKFLLKHFPDVTYIRPIF